MSMSSCIVVIPFYATELTENEKVSLKKVSEILHAYELCLICPENLEIPLEYSYFKCVRFKQKNFQGVQGYNQLLLSDFFYESFLQYEYILIYQLDALVFKDELDYWCSIGFDYYGSPWVRKNWKFKYFNFFGLLKKNVGNGGFSLRRTKTFWIMAKRIRLIKRHIRFGEDIFWCNFGCFFYRKFKIVDTEMAIKFAFETEPEKLFAMNENQLPFGCHAFEKNGLSFWKKLVPELK